MNQDPESQEHIGHRAAFFAPVLLFWSADILFCAAYWGRMRGANGVRLMMMGFILGCCVMAASLYLSRRRQAEALRGLLEGIGVAGVLHFGLCFVLIVVR